MRLRFAALSDVGRVRRMNEDAVLAEPPVFLVADGMGGHARGDAASAAAVESFRDRLATGAPVTTEEVLHAIATANEAVRAVSDDADEGLGRAGTTVAGVAVVSGEDGPEWLVFNVGDSRVYGWDGGRLVQLSRDHSAVQELVDAGVIRAEDAEHHPDRNVITRALGADEVVEPDELAEPLAAWPAILVCSDGLTRELSDARIARILAAAPDGPASAAAALLDAALEHGARDNVSVVIVEARAG